MTRFLLGVLLGAFLSQELWLRNALLIVGVPMLAALVLWRYFEQRREDREKLLREYPDWNQLRKK